jgi:hypothetical protein
MDCINLKQRFGRRFKVTHEESREAEFGDGARTVDPWLLLIPCQYGHIFPWGDSLLAASVDGHPRVARKIAALDCCTVVQDGDDGELTATFDEDDFRQVADLMKPRRRRQVSEAERKRLADLSARHGFKPRQRIVNDEYSGRRRDSRHRGVSDTLNAKRRICSAEMNWRPTIAYGRVGRWNV